MRYAVRPAAGTEDVLAGIAVRHEAYGRTMPLLVYQAGRLASRRERRAVPWVLDRGDGTVVSTLLCHPIRLALDDRVWPGYGIGSVGTRVGERRQGFAAALCAAVCEANERAGRPVGLLYSDIGPAYYERLGFTTSPAWEGRCERLADLAAPTAAALEPIDPRREVERLCALYREHHRGRLHPHWDTAGFLESVEYGEGDCFFAVRGLDGGYLRLRAERDKTLDVEEAILADPDDEEAALRAAARLALDAGMGALTAWLAPSPFVRAWFAPRPRGQGLPMLRGAPPHASAWFWASDHF